MTIHRLYQHRAFEPEAIAAMTGAYAEVCRQLGIDNNDLPQVMIVAEKVIEFAQRGACDPMLLRDCVLKALRS
ncbi:MAG TPA: hypothetical protein VH206_07845 [Xanthobacteraceae bacterium]|jgi:hypothetical protein|nr:hypothetical protein [Xanthobacteraceae bacterium]